MLTDLYFIIYRLEPTIVPSLLTVFVILLFLVIVNRQLVYVPNPVATHTSVLIMSLNTDSSLFILGFWVQKGEDRVTEEGPDESTRGH